MDTLRTYMQANDLTQTDVARAVDVSQSLVSMWLSGERTVSLKHALRLQRWSNHQIAASSLTPEVRELLIEIDAQARQGCDKLHTSEDQESGA